jgi:uncharacterized protein (TIGR01777 family)
MNSASARAVLVGGGTGFIGGHLVETLRRRGDEVWVWTRNRNRAVARFGSQVLAVTSLEEIPTTTHIDAAVALAGAPVIGPPWTSRRRRLLIDSRVGTTNTLLEWCARRADPPRVLVAASAIGFYGPAGDDWMQESSPPAPAAFQSRMCVEREAAANAASAQGIRVVNLRIGLVLGRDGGIYPRLALPAKLGVAAVIGNGRQWMSWIHIADLVRVIERALDDATLNGALNAVAPDPVRQRDFERELTRALHRPLWLRIPAFALDGLLGEMAELLVRGQRVAPHRLAELGFVFEHGTLESALQDLTRARS